MQSLALDFGVPGVGPQHPINAALAGARCGLARLSENVGLEILHVRGCQDAPLPNLLSAQNGKLVGPV